MHCAPKERLTAGEFVEISKVVSASQGRKGGIRVAKLTSW